MSHIIRVHSLDKEKIQKLEEFLKLNDIEFEVSNSGDEYELSNNEKQILNKRDASGIENAIPVDEVNERIQKKYGL
jgi:hypothetical protein